MPANEESKCCISLVLYPEQFEWGLLWDISRLEPVLQHLVRASLCRYSSTFALDLWVAQADRNNMRNVILGVDGNPDHTEFIFLDHSFTLNNENRWRDERWKAIEMVSVPNVFRESFVKDQVLAGAAGIAGMSDDVIQEIVQRIPDDFMPERHKEIVIDGLVGRKSLIKDFIEKSL
ncbi:MAG TPA: hypothetical protein VGT03_12855 [Candidatus Acidoferrales bacterium]|nr:hypothetical protein [Candidatus Acidoferrales bacterium]